MAHSAHLQLVDTQTGLVYDDCPNCRALGDQLAGAEKDIAAWRARFAALKREKDAEARSHDLWPQAVRLFDVWKRLCDHPRSQWTPDRFWLVEPFLSDDGFDLCLRAIAGAAFDPWTKRRRNGSTYRHDWWEDIFSASQRARKVFEDHCNSAPADWRDQVGVSDG